MSNMLITDLKNNIHPNKVTFLERSQLNKILDEQGLQKSKNFDNSTAVNFGKLAGVNYVLVGSVYVLEGECNLSSRLVNVETSEIIHAKESNGRITNWLSLKTNLASELSKALNNPITIDSELSSEPTTEGVLVQYSNVLNKVDEGNLDEAKQMAEMLADVQPDFKYFSELSNEIEKINKKIAELKIQVDLAVENPYQLAIEKSDYDQDYETAITYFELAKDRIRDSDPYANNKRLFIDSQIGLSYYYLGQFEIALKHFEYCENLFPWLFEAVFGEIKVLIQLGRSEEAREKYFETLDHITYYFEEDYKKKYSKVKFDYGELKDGFNIFS